MRTVKHSVPEGAPTTLRALRDLIDTMPDEVLDMEVTYPIDTWAVDSWGGSIETGVGGATIL